MDLNCELAELVELGKSWGMSKAEIKACLQAELFNERSGKSASSSSSCSLWRCLKIMLLFPILLMASLVAGYALFTTISAVFPEVDNVVGKVGQPYVYPAMRSLRMIFKPLADKFDIAGYYNAECLINNPFFVDPVEDCWPCEEKTKFEEVNANETEAPMQNIDDFTPFVIRNYQNAVGLSKLKELVSRNEQRFTAGGTTFFKSNIPSMYNISHILNYDLSQLASAAKGAAHILWESNSVSSAQAIRKLFPRPSYVPDSAEVSLMKRIYIDGPLSGEYSMPISSFANTWYQQAEGTRRITLIPHVSCQEDCKPFSTVVNEGDHVSFQDQYWTLVSSPVYKSHKEELSVAFTGSFTF